jgi:WD40 repeat protein
MKDGKQILTLFVIFTNLLRFNIFLVLFHSDSRHWVSDVKFSPNGKSFAVASMDHKIYIYNGETYRLKGTCDRHNSYIKEVNYSADSMYIQSDSADNEHLFFEAEDGEYFAAGSQLKDIKWADWTCLYGWPVQGIVLFSCIIFCSLEFNLLLFSSKERGLISMMWSMAVLLSRPRSIGPPITSCYA